MTNNSAIHDKKEFDTFFDKLWKNRNRVPLQISNLSEDIEFISNYYKNSNSYTVFFDTNRLLESDFLDEIENLINNGLNVDKANGTIKFPFEYIINNITDRERSALKLHFKDIDSRFNDTSLYIDNRDLIDKFKKDFDII